MSQTKFIELTLDNDDRNNTTVCINIDQICAFYTSPFGEELTMIQFAGKPDNFIEVKETPEEIKELLYKFE